MERQIEEALQALFEAIEYCDVDELSEAEEIMQEAVGEVRSVETYETAGVLTTDNGVRVRLANGREVYLTIKVQ